MSEPPSKAQIPRLQKFIPAPVARTLHKRCPKTRRSSRNSHSKLPQALQKIALNEFLFAPPGTVTVPTPKSSTEDSEWQGVLASFNSQSIDWIERGEQFIKEYGGRLLGGAQDQISWSILLKGVALPGVAAVLAGLDFGSSSAALISLKHYTNWVSTPSYMGLIIAAASCGSIFGSGVSYTSSRLGPRHMLISAAFLALIGALVQCSATSLPTLVVGRFIYGISMGLANVALPQYVADFAPTENRGSLMGYQEIFFSGGILGGAVFAHSFVGVASGWRIIWGSPAFVAGAAFIALCVFLEETPRALLLAGGTKEQAFRLLKKIRKAPERVLREEIEEIALSVKPPPPRSREEARTRNDLGGWDSSVHKRLLGLGILTAAVQAASGHFSILYYAPQFLKNEFAPAYTLTILIYATKFISSIPATYMLDRFKRRTLLTIGLAGMTASFGAMAHLPPEYTIIAAAANVFFYQCSVGPVSWIMSSELFPSHLRLQGGSLVLISNAIFNTIVLQMHPMIFTAGGFITTFWIYGGLCAVGGLTVWWVLPETQGRSLEQIQRMAYSNTLFNKFNSTSSLEIEGQEELLRIEDGGRSSTDVGDGGNPEAIPADDPQFNQ